MASRSPPFVVCATLAFSAARAAAAGDGRAPSEYDPQRASDTEFVPLLGGDSDGGFGGGYIMSLARVKPDLDPYLWRVESAGSS